MDRILKLLFLFSLYYHFVTVQGEFSEQHSHDNKRLNSQKKRDRHINTTLLHFYFHDILDTDHPTTVKIINSPIGSFGATYMVDVPLTSDPNLNSTVIGRAQGTYAMASQQNDDLAFKMDINFVFLEGIYQGSTLIMLGRNAIMEDVREMAIVGGTGAFRFARGYALAKTAWYNSTSGNSVEEYNVTVRHF